MVIIEMIAVIFAACVVGLVAIKLLKLVFALINKFFARFGV